MAQPNRREAEMLVALHQAFRARNKQDIKNSSQRKSGNIRFVIGFSLNIVFFIYNYWGAERDGTMSRTLARHSCDIHILMRSYFASGCYLGSSEVHTLLTNTLIFHRNNLSG